MCNRFRSVQNANQLAERFKTFSRLNFPDNPNVAPTDEVPIIALDQNGERKTRLARFGLVPRWSKDTKTAFSMTNARVESVTTKPAYRNIYKKQRCIIPAEGYYEWREENGIKQPYLFSLKDGDLMAMAGLWEFAKVNDEEIWSFTIITNEPNSLAKPIHDRMPCILPIENIDNWLDPTKGGIEQLILFPSEDMQIKKMSTVVNSVKVKDRDLIDQSLGV